MSYTAALIAVLVMGLIPAVVFLVWHGIPRYWRSIAAADASLWVLTVIAMYGWFLFRLLTAPVSHRPWDWSAVVSITIGLLFDSVLWLRLAHWIIVGRRRLAADTQRENS